MGEIVTRNVTAVPAAEARDDGMVKAYMPKESIALVAMTIFEGNGGAPVDVMVSVAVAAEGKPNALHVTTACAPIMYVDADVMRLGKPMLGAAMEKNSLVAIMEPAFSLIWYIPAAVEADSMLTNGIGPATGTPALMLITAAVVSLLTSSITTLPVRPADHQVTAKGCPAVDIWPATGERTLSSPAAATTANDIVSTQSVPSAVATRTK